MRLLFVHVTSIGSAKNIPEVDIAMKKMRSINGFFESSPQATLNFLIFKARATSRSITNSPNQIRLSKMLKQGGGQLIEVSSA